MPVPTEQEILKRFKERKPNDPFGFEVNEYLDYLSFDSAMSLVPDDKRAEAEKDRNNWKQRTLDRDAMVKVILDYLPFAWDKANDCRGISAQRSIQHFIAWTWLAGDTEFSDEIDLDFQNYEHYGKEILIKVSKRYGFDYGAHDNGSRVNSEDEE